MSPLPWKRYLLSGVVAAALYMLFPTTDAGTLLYGCIAISAVAAIWVGSRRYRPPRPWGWRLFAIGLAWFAAGDLAFAIVTGDARRPPAASAADLFYLFGYVFLAAGLLTLAPRARAMFDLGEAIDAAILVVGAGVLLWLGAIAPVAARVAADPWAQRLALA
ncbi:MAG TPA: hypothetical protein VFQ80_01365, partial [Thermomicrobiales bacterium]|nr:hypothetical protein [Thermomicrobiales bacterium]